MFLIHLLFSREANLLKQGTNITVLMPTIWVTGELINALKIGLLIKRCQVFFKLFQLINIVQLNYKIKLLIDFKYNFVYIYNILKQIIMIKQSLFLLGFNDDILNNQRFYILAVDI